MLPSAEGNSNSESYEDEHRNNNNADDQSNIDFINNLNVSRTVFKTRWNSAQIVNDNYCLILTARKLFDLIDEYVCIFPSQFSYVPSLAMS